MSSKISSGDSTDEYSTLPFCTIVTNNGFDCQEYKDAVITSDFPNYKLTIHRIRNR